MSPILILAFTLSLTRSVKGKREGFIVGGESASNIKDFAHCAFLDINDDTSCGASILNQNILATAAHCLLDARIVMATVGSLNRNTGKHVLVAKYKAHERYNTRTISNDIGLCKLKTPLQLGQQVKRVVLMKTPPADEEGMVAGWGAVNEINYQDTYRLKHTKQKLWSNQNCKKVLKQSLPAGTICGGELRSQTNFASKGDSGGPLVVRKYIQVGLVSFKDTRQSRSLVAYTDVVYFYDWIMKAARTLTC